jgi:hypothetical protein
MPARISIGHLFATTFAIVLHALAPLLALILLVLLPLMAVLGLAAGGGSAMALSLPALMGMAVVTSAATYLVQGAITIGVADILRGESFQLRRALTAAVARLLPLIGLALTLSVMLALGYLAMIIPGLVLQCIVFVAVPALMIEGTGVAGSIVRSYQLTDGQRLKIFALFLLVQLLVHLPLTLLAWTLDDVLAATAPELSSVLSILLTGLAGAVSAVASAVTYFQLRGGPAGQPQED